MADWVKVYSTSMLYNAEIIKQLLADHNIPAFVLNQKDSFYHFGDIEVCVRAADVVRAKHLLNKMDNLS